MTTLPAEEIPAEELAVERPALWRDPLVIGTVCGLIAAVGYTATNACLRQVVEQSPSWVACLRALPTVLIFGPWVLAKKSRGEAVLPSARVMCVILLGAVASQLFGNILFQWSLGIVGLAMAVPLCLGTLIVGGAVLGRIFLHEPITPRVATSLAILLGAIVVLSLGAHDAHRSVAVTLTAAHDAPHPWWWIPAGVVAAIASGVGFATMGACIRSSMMAGAAPTTMMLTTGIVGTLGLGLLSWQQIGTAAMLATPHADLAAMLGAGVLNALSFIFMTRALQLTTVAHAYALNATQATMATLAGVFFFQEALTPWLSLGVVLTIAGLLYMSRRDARK